MKSLEWSLDSFETRLDCSHDFVCCLCDALGSPKMDYWFVY